MTKKLTTISLFIFGVVLVAVVVSGLIFYDNNKNLISDSSQGVDQLQQQVRVIRGGLGAIRLMPTQELRGGRFALTSLTAVALRAIAKIHRMAQDRQMTHHHPIVAPVRLANLATTTTAACAIQGALHRDNKLTLLRELGLQDSHIWNVERNCNLSCRHGGDLSGIAKRILTILPHLRPTRSCGSHGNSQ